MSEVYEGFLDEDGNPIATPIAPEETVKAVKPVEIVGAVETLKEGAYTGELDGNGQPVSGIKVDTSEPTEVIKKIESEVAEVLKTKEKVIEETENEDEDDYMTITLPSGVSGVSSPPIRVKRSEYEAEQKEKADAILADLKQFPTDMRRSAQLAARNVTSDIVDVGENIRKGLNKILPESLMLKADTMTTLERDKFLNDATEKLFSGLIDPLDLYDIDWNDPDIVDQETNRIKLNESTTAMIADMAILTLASRNPTIATQKYLSLGTTKFPAVTAAVSNFVGFTAAGLVLLDRDTNLANVLEDSLKDSEEPEADYFGKTALSYVAADNDDTTAEKRLKIVIEGAAIAVVAPVLIGVTKGAVWTTKGAFSKTKKILKGRDPKTLSDEETRVATFSYFQEAKERAAVLDLDTLSETAAGIKQMDAQTGAGKNFSGRVKAFLYRTKQRMFTERGLASPLVYEASLNSKYNQRQIITAAEDTGNRLNNAFRSAGNSPELKTKVNILLETDLTSVFEVAPEKRLAYFAKQENISEDVAEAVLTARQSIDELSIKALNTPGFTEEAKAAIEADLTTYIRSSYDAFEKAGFTYDVELKRGAKESIARGIVTSKTNAALDKGAPLTPKQLENLEIKAQKLAQVQLEEMLEGAEPSIDFVAQSARVGKFFKRNENLTPEIKAVLGEVTEPSDRIILSVSKVARIIETQNFYNTVMKLGHNNYIFNPDTIAAKGIGDKGRRYTATIQKTNSDLDGMKTTPEVAEMLANKQATFEAFEADNPLAESYRYFVMSKGFAQSMKTVYSLSTQARNVTGAYQFGIANGLVFDQVTANAGKVLAYRLNSTMGTAAERKAAQEQYQEYQKLGVINTQVTVNLAREMMEGGFEGFAKRRKQLKEASEEVPFVGPFVRMVDSAVEQVGGSTLGDVALRKPAQVYTASDDFFKIGVYEKELQTLREAFPDVADETLKNEAAEIVKNTMPNYDRIPNTLKALSKTPVGNFVAFPAEIIRTTGYIAKQSLKEIRSSNPVIRRRGLKRLAGFTAANVGYLGIAKASQIALGMSDQEVEDRKLLSSGPFSAGHDMVFTRDSNGDIYGLNTQYLNSYYYVAAPFRTAYDAIAKGNVQGQELDDIAIDAITGALNEITKPYISESIAVGPIRSMVSAWWSETGRDSSGKQIFSSKEGVEWDTIIEVLKKSFEPAFLSKAEDLVDSINKTPSDWDQSYRSPKYEAWSQIGFKWDKQDLSRNLASQVRAHQKLERNTGLDRIKFSTTIEEVENDFIKTNAVEFQLQQDLYLYIKAARRQMDDITVMAVLKEQGYGSLPARKLMRGEFQPTALRENLLRENTPELQKLTETDFHDYQERLIEMQSLGSDLYNQMSLMPLDRAKEFNKIGQRRLFSDDRKLEFDEEIDDSFLLPKATGGEISEPVANAPTEPDERINKLTGLPYNEGAGAAYMDADDPLRAMNMAAGGRVKKDCGGKVLNTLRRNQT